MKGFRKIIICLLFAFGASGQTIEKDLTMIGDVYKKNKKLSMNITYKVYKTRKSAQPVDVNYGIYQRYNESYRNKLDQVESVVTSDFSLFIDTLRRQMIYTKSTSQKISQFDPAQIAALMSNYKYVEAIGALGKGTTAYRLWLNDNYSTEVEYFDVVFDSKTFFIKQMNLVYNRQIDFGRDNEKDMSSPKIEICFSNIETNPKLNESMFLLSTYLTGNKGSYKATGKYKNYEVNSL